MDAHDKQKKESSSITLITQDKQSELLEVTNEGMDYLNQLTSNFICTITVTGTQHCEKSTFANLIIGDKDTFNTQKTTNGIHMWGQPIVHQDNTDLLVFDTEGFIKNLTNNTNYEKQTFIMSCLLSSVLVFHSDDNLNNCIQKFVNLAKESLNIMKKSEDKELSYNDMPIVYFILHNNIDQNSVNSQFETITKNEKIFQKYFKNSKVYVLSKNTEKRSNTLTKTKTSVANMDNVDDAEYKKKSKEIKDDIMSNLEPKKINNCNLDGKCLFGLIQSFVDLLNKGENIFLYNQFNNVLSLCLTDIVDQLNFAFTPNEINKRIKDNINNEENFIDAIRMTLLNSFNDQFEKFNSNPIVKISPASNIFSGINSIFRKCLDTLTENIKNMIEKKLKIVEDLSKNDFMIPNKLDQNIEQLLYSFSNFISEKILSPLFEPNDNKLQNNDNILNVLKKKCCETLEKMSPLIQGQINKLIEENKQLKTDFNNQKNKYQKIIQQKDDEIGDFKLKIEKQDRVLKDKEIENMTVLSFEKEKYNQLEKKYNLEINEKNTHIQELMKNAKSITMSSLMMGSGEETGGKIPMEALKNEYNDISNILIKYKMMVTKLLNDKDFFFEDILVGKTIIDLRKKNPEIFNLLSEKEDLEKIKSNFNQQIEILRRENKRLSEKLDSQDLEISDLREKLNETNKNLDDKIAVIEVKNANNASYIQTIEGYETKLKEAEIVSKKKEKEKANAEQKAKELEKCIFSFDIKFQEQEKTAKDYAKKMGFYVEQIDYLCEILEAIVNKQKEKFVTNFDKLDKPYKETVTRIIKNFKFSKQ